MTRNRRRVTLAMNGVRIHNRQHNTQKKKGQNRKQRPTQMWLGEMRRPIFSGVRVTRSLVLCVCFVDRCLSFCAFFFWPLCCLFVFDIRILIVPFVSSMSSLNPLHWIIESPTVVQILTNLHLFASTKRETHYHKMSNNI
jgi:hypothetical protein